MSWQRRTSLLTGVLCAATALAQAPPPAASQATQAQVAQPATAPQRDLPEAPYVALTRHEKFHAFTRQLYSPYTFLSAGMNATYEQMTGDPYQFGGGMEGWGKRFGASLASMESGRFFNRFLFPVILHQDPRYFPAKPHTRLLQRGWYAATRVLVTRNDSGSSQFNYSEILGDLCTVSLANAYYPAREHGFGDTMSRFTGALLSNAGSNVTREFWPDIKRIFRHHEPKRMQDIQEKIEKRMPQSLRGDQPQ